MNLPVILSPAAAQDFEEAAAWYEQHARLGKRFVERTEEALSRIAALPELHAMIHQTMAEPMDCSLVVAMRPGISSPAATRW